MRMMHVITRNPRGEVVIDKTTVGNDAGLNQWQQTRQALFASKRCKRERARARTKKRQGSKRKVKTKPRQGTTYMHNPPHLAAASCKFTKTMTELSEIN